MASSFDYAVPRDTLGFVGRLALDAVSRRVKKAGEPFQGFFAPAELDRASCARWATRTLRIWEARRSTRATSAGRTDKLRAGSQLGGS